MRSSFILLSVHMGHVCNYTGLCSHINKGIHDSFSIHVSDYIHIIKAYLYDAHDRPAQTHVKHGEEWQVNGLHLECIDISSASYTRRPHKCIARAKKNLHITYFSI